VRQPAVRLGLDSWLGSPECLRARALLAAGDAVTLLVTADREEAAFERAAALVAEAGVPAVRLRWSEGPLALGGGAESLLAIHAVARGAVPVVRLAVSDDPSAPEPPALHGVAGPLVLAAKEGFTPKQGARPLVALPVPRLRPAESGRSGSQRCRSSPRPPRCSPPATGWSRRWRPRWWRTPALLPISPAGR
jgi:hypothetical protein